MNKLLKILLAAAGVAFCSGIAAAAVLTQTDVAPYLQPQRMVDVGGHRLNLYCTGHGSPAVIFDAGQGYSSWSWYKVQPKVAKFTTACSYDRAGMGFSDGGPLPRDAKNTVSDLHALLHNAGIKPPYVLVAHSIAGLYAPLFADIYPQEVAGMVLVDPSFPYESKAFDALVPAMKTMDAEGAAAAQTCYQAALHGKLTLQNGSAAYAPCGFPPHIADALKAQCAQNGTAFCRMMQTQYKQLTRPPFWSTFASEGQSENASDSREDVASQRSYGAMPLVVLTAANDTGGSPFPPALTKAFNRVLVAGHEAIARHSSVGVNFIVHRSGHFIQEDRPAAVVSAIYEVLSQIRR